MKKILYVGMDVHKNSIDIALAEEGTAEVRHYGRMRWSRFVGQVCGEVKL
jgi:hypothetical protein